MSTFSQIFSLKSDFFPGFLMFLAVFAFKNTKSTVNTGHFTANRPIWAPSQGVMVLRAVKSGIWVLIVDLSLGIGLNEAASCCINMDLPHVRVIAAGFFIIGA